MLTCFTWSEGYLQRNRVLECFIVHCVGCFLPFFSSGPSTARREYRVGQYVVDLISFEQLTLPLLRNVSNILEFLEINMNKWIIHDEEFIVKCLVLFYLGRA